MGLRHERPGVAGVRRPGIEPVDDQVVIAEQQRDRSRCEGYRIGERHPGDVAPEAGSEMDHPRVRPRRICRSTRKPEIYI